MRKDDIYILNNGKFKIKVIDFDEYSVFYTFLNSVRFGISTLSVEVFNMIYKRDER